MNTDDVVQKTIEAESLGEDLGAASQTHGEVTNEHSDDIPAAAPVHLVTPITRSPVIHNNTFSLQLENVSDEIVTNNLEGNHESILSPIKKKNIRCQ